MLFKFQGHYPHKIQLLLQQLQPTKTPSPLKWWGFITNNQHKSKITPPPIARLLGISSIKSYASFHLTFTRVRRRWRNVGVRECPEPKTVFVGPKDPYSFRFYFVIRKQCITSVVLKRFLEEIKFVFSSIYANSPFSLDNWLSPKTIICISWQ